MALLAREINCHFLENEYGDLSFFLSCFELSNYFSFCRKNIDQFPVENKRQSMEM